MPPAGSKPVEIYTWLLQDPDSHAAALLVMLVDRYGTECLNWHPTTIRMQLEQDFATPSDDNFDKLMAGVALTTTNYYFRNLSRFLDLTNALCGHGFDPNTVNLPDSAELAWGLTEATIISPPEEEEQFDDEIRHFIGAVLNNEGYIKPPKTLQVALGGDISQHVEDNWGDDPEMWLAINQSHASKTVEIDQMVQRCLKDLVEQISILPLQNGDQKEGLVQRIRNEMRITSPGK
jgi:hypothetical protein